jgi:hypothetical protein
MTEYVADDVAAIAARLKEIEAEKAAARAKPAPAEPAKPEDAAKNSTQTGSGGGFKTPDGGIYDPYCF